THVDGGVERAHSRVGNFERSGIVAGASVHGRGQVALELVDDRGDGVAAAAGVHGRGQVALELVDDRGDGVAAAAGVHGRGHVALELVDDRGDGVAAVAGVHRPRHAVGHGHVVQVHIDVVRALAPAEVD